MSSLISTSILSADLSNVETEIKKLKSAGADYIHFDVMDGIFVDNLTFGAPLVKSARAHTGAAFDVHLMIQNPQKYIEDFAEAGSDIITFHYEAASNAEEVIKLIRQNKKKVGISIKPSTKFSEIKKYIKHIDLLLIMLVEPGFGGQEIMADQFDKISEAAKFIQQNKCDVLISVDGGVNDKNANKLKELGANILVSGSFITKSEDYKKQIQLLR